LVAAERVAAASKLSAARGAADDSARIWHGAAASLAV
jgi:hypothetical protein